MTLVIALEDVFLGNILEDSDGFVQDGVHLCFGFLRSPLMKTNALEICLTHALEALLEILVNK